MENTLFTNPGQETTGLRRLDCTAALVQYSDEKARNLLNTVNGNKEFEDLLKQSFSDSSAQDKLIADVLGSLSTESVSEADEPQLKKLLASQQSKRSRAKGKDMTVANYLAMMSAAIAETIIRTTLGQPRGTAGQTGTALVVLTDEELQAYSKDLDLTNRKIRSLQSWCSTHKHLGVDGPEYAIVRGNIAALQALRPASTSIKVVKEDPRITEIRSKLSNVDISKLKAAEKDALVESILKQLEA